jgi:uncharacterized OsmC-like protein
MPQTATVEPRREVAPHHGVDTPKLFATIGVVKEQPVLAKFQFRATNRWLRGTHSRTEIRSFHGAGAEQTRDVTFDFDADHPAVLTGGDAGPTPVEFLLHALSACLTAGIANVAAARGITLTAVQSTVVGDIDLRGILGLSKEVRNGYERIRVSFRVEGDAPAEKLREVVAQSKARSAVFDVITKGVPVEVTVEAA